MRSKVIVKGRQAALRMLVYLREALEPGVPGIDEGRK